MRSTQRISILVLCFFLLALIPCSTFGDTVKSPAASQIIPTKYRLLQILMEEETQVTAEQVVTEPVAADSSTVPEREGSHSAVRMSQDSSGSSDSIAGLQPDSSYQGMGKGFVQTNFDVSLVDQGKRVENRERLTARGLFDVHVIHEFN